MVLGIDVGATKTAWALSPEPGVLLERMEEPTQGGVEQLRTIIASNAASVDAVGVALVGHVDPGLQVWKHALNIPGEYPYALQDLSSLPLFADNDVKASTLGELVFGYGKTYEDVLVLNLGSGVSLGIIAGGAILRGHDNYSGEVGYLPVWDGKQYRPLETLLGGLGLAQFHPPGAPDLFLGAGRGDKQVLEHLCLLRTLLENLLVGLLHVFNSQAVALCGSLALQPVLTENLEARVRPRLLRETNASLSVIGPSLVGAQNSALLGATALAWRNGN